MLRQDSAFTSDMTKPGAPKPKLANEKPKGETVSYNELLKSWEVARK